MSNSDPPVPNTSNSDYFYVEPTYEIEHYTNLTSTWSTDSSKPWLNRYFTRHYFILKTKDGQDVQQHHCVLQCPNKLAIITLHTSHELFQHIATFSSLSSKSSELYSASLVRSIEINYPSFITSATVSGKRKKHAAKVNTYTDIAQITCPDGKDFSIKACMKGQVLEVNERLQGKPGENSSGVSKTELLIEKSLTNGFIAVIRPNDERLRGLKTDVEYAEYVEENLRSRRHEGEGEPNINEEQNQVVGTQKRLRETGENDLQNPGVAGSKKKRKLDIANIDGAEGESAYSTVCSMAVCL